MPIAVLIPALKPSSSLVDVVDALVASDQVESIIVINDGSPPDYDAVFAASAQHPKVTLLRHAVNLGKGAGIRTGMNHFLCTASPDCVLVTADADGQHLPKDILAVGARAELGSGQLVMGSRSFTGEVPLRSRFGNDVTRFIFRTLIGKKVSDTQTGLRAIPRKLMPTLMRLKNSGYEFELEMLIVAARENVPIVSVEIETVYLDNNASSHFNPLMDSMRIYFVFARFLSSAVLTAIIDYAVFFIVYHFTSGIFFGIFSGRLVAGSVNFTINKRYVFRFRDIWHRTLLRYALLVAALGCVAYLMTDYLVTRNGWNAYLAKVCVDGVLLLGSFVMQRDVVFAKRAFDPSTEDSVTTDWDAYYARPYATSRFTHQHTGAVLEKLIHQYAPSGNGPLRIVELGGANSCFYEQLTEALHPRRYDVVDNNQIGLDAFRKKVPPGADGTAHSLDLLTSEVDRLAGQYDLSFSMGVVEHFDKDGTARVIAAHFTMLRPGGVAIIAYPTPTWLYRATRFASEKSGQWIFWDERPLKKEEVMDAIRPHGELLHTEINWWILLTQGIVVVRKPLAATVAAA
jgi:glycosyltransferase involved in cell wall biosynthesis